MQSEGRGAQARHKNVTALEGGGKLQCRACIGHSWRILGSGEGRHRIPPAENAMKSQDFYPGHSPRVGVAGSREQVGALGLWMLRGIPSLFPGLAAQTRALSMSAVAQVELQGEAPGSHLEREERQLRRRSAQGAGDPAKIPELQPKPRHTGLGPGKPRPTLCLAPGSSPSSRSGAGVRCASACWHRGWQPACSCPGRRRISGSAGRSPSPSACASWPAPR